MKAESTQLKSKMADLHGDVGTYRVLLDGHKAKINDLTNDRNVMNSKIDDLSTKMAALSNTNVQQTTSTRESVTTDVRKELDSITEDLHKHNQDMQGIRTTVNDVNQKLDTMRNEIDGIKDGGNHQADKNLKDYEGTLNTLINEQGALKDKVNRITEELDNIKKNEDILNDSVKILTDTQDKCVTRIEGLEISDRDHVVILDGIELLPNKSLTMNTVDTLNRYSDINLRYGEIEQCNFYGKMNRDNQPRPIRVKFYDRKRKKDLL